MAFFKGWKNVPLLISIAAGGSAIPRISPYVARVSFTLWQQGYPIGKWAAEQGGSRRRSARLAGRCACARFWRRGSAPRTGAEQSPRIM